MQNDRRYYKPYCTVAPNPEWRKAQPKEFGFVVIGWHKSDLVEIAIEWKDKVACRVGIAKKPIGWELC